MTQTGLRVSDFVHVFDSSIDDFLRKVKDTETPTDEQVKAFVNHVSQAHSWYKHWEPKKQKTSLLIYLNPNSGLVFEKDEKEELWYPRERTRQGRFGCYHYNENPTPIHRGRFGFLDFVELTKPERHATLIPELRPFLTPVTAVLHPDYPELGAKMYGESNTFYHEKRTPDELKKLREEQLEGLVRNTGRLIAFVKNSS